MRFGYKFSEYEIMPGTSSTKESDSSAQRHSLDLISNGTFGSYVDIKERVFISISFILVSLQNKQKLPLYLFAFLPCYCEICKDLDYVN